MIINKVKQEGNSIFIKSNPITGVLALTSFTDNSSGEGGGKSFTKTFRYSKNGVIFSDWYPLTVQNILTLDVDSKDILVFELQYKRNPVGDPDLIVSSASIDTTDAIIEETDLFKNSIFYQYFSSNDLGVLNWMINVLDKLFQKGLLPNYIERYNDMGSPDDFLEFWGGICKYFAYYVTYARNYQKFYENESLISEYLEQRGLKVSPTNTLGQLQTLMEKYNREVAKRGTLNIISKSVENADEIDGEFLRLIHFDYELDELIFNINKSEHAGWNLNNSSPIYRSITIQDNANKFFEKDVEPTEIDLYPVNGTVSISEDTDIGKRVFNISANSGIGQLSGQPTAFKIPVSEYMDYEFSFFIKKSEAENLTVGFNALDANGNQINLISRSTGAVLNNYFVNKDVLRHDIYVYCRFFLYNKLKPLYSYDGLNLKMVDGVKFIIPKILIGAGGTAKVYNVRLMPMALPYSKCFVQLNNFIDSIIKNNNNQYLITDIENHVRKYLIPYNSHIKISETNLIGDYSQDTYIAPEEYPTLPTVITSEASDIAAVSARLGGEVTDSGNSIINEHGIVWSTSPDPTIADNRVPIGMGAISFSRIVSGLPSGIAVYVKAYAINSVGISYGDEITFETTFAVASINRLDTNPTNEGTVQFEVIFTGTVTGVSSSNFVITGSGVSGASIDSVSGSGSNYIVTVHTGSGSGTVGLNMANDTGLSLEVGNLPFLGQLYLVDKDAPTVSITSNPASITNQITAEFAFSGSDTGGSGLAGFLVSLDGGAYESASSPKTYSGLSNAEHIFRVKAVDNAGNESIPVEYSWTVDTVAPTVVSSVRYNPTDVETGENSVIFRMTFSKGVTGVNLADFILNTTGSVAATLASVSAVSSSVYDITVNSITGTGLLELELKSTGTGIQDSAGNSIVGGYTDGESYNIVNEGSVTVTSSLAGTSITSITGIYGFTLANPVSVGGSETGTHTAFSLSTITVSFSGSPVIEGNCTLRVNGVTIACTNIPVGVTFTEVVFDNVSADLLDPITIAFNTGSCA